MPLEPIDRLMQRCREGRFAIGYFESWNLESLQGTLDAAEQTRSPTIIGFNGEFLCHDARCDAEHLSTYGKLGQAIAETSSVPCGLIFNECPNDQWVMDAVDSGFNLVMPADPHATVDDYTRRVKRIVQHAHGCNVAVEAELGELPCGLSEGAELNSQMTDPEVAERFVRETGADLLAVSAGNIHLHVHGEKDLDLDHLAILRDRIPVPLVLHGGTGITSGSLREAVRLGVAKVNYGTYIKRRCIDALRAALAVDHVNPHHVLGFGGEADLGIVVRHTVRDAILERIELLSCCGKA